jgi:hypothetical protein
MINLIWILLIAGVVALAIFILKMLFQGSTDYPLDDGGSHKRNLEINAEAKRRKL